MLLVIGAVAMVFAGLRAALSKRVTDLAHAARSRAILLLIRAATFTQASEAARAASGRVAKVPSEAARSRLARTPGAGISRARGAATPRTPAAEVGRAGSGACRRAGKHHRSAAREQVEGFLAAAGGYGECAKGHRERNGAGGIGRRTRHHSPAYHHYSGFQLARLLFRSSGTMFTKVSSSPRLRPDPRLRVVPSAGASEAASGALGLSVQRTPTDEELIDAVQRGDHQVASVIYERLVGVVDHTLYRVFGRREVDHDDLVQAAFEQIVVTLSRRSYARACSLRTWASSIASHVGFNALRSRRRERRVLDREAGIEAEPMRAGVDVEGEASARAELERLRIQLSEMKSTHAEAVFLHDVLGHELAEIALMTQVSVSAAQSRLVRGRRELFRRLDHVPSRRKSEPS